MNPTFVESFVHVKKKPALKNPVLLVGLPGIGFVSKMAVDHLVKQLRAEHFATIYSPHFPNQVIALKNGKLRLFSIRLYRKRMKNRDLVLLRGDLQPLTVEGQYEVSSKALEFFASLGGKEVIAMAGYAVNKKGGKPAVYCSSTNRALFESFLKKGAKRNPLAVPIVGMAGMLPALSRLYGLKGACLLVETPGNTIDAVGARELLAMISAWLGEKFDVGALESRAKKAERMLKKMEQQAKLDEQAALAGPTIPPLYKKDELSYIR